MDLNAGRDLQLKILQPGGLLLRVSQRGSQLLMRCCSVHGQPRSVNVFPVDERLAKNQEQLVERVVDCGDQPRGRLETALVFEQLQHLFIGVDSRDAVFSRLQVLFL